MREPWEKGRKPHWLNRIPEIRAWLEGSDAPFLDRSAVERAFGLRRRQAISVLHELGAYQVGQALVAPRERVLAFLSGAATTRAGRAEIVRRRRVREILEEARKDTIARGVRFLVPSPTAQAPPPTIAGLPGSVRLSKGELHMTFTKTEELLQLLFQLSKAIASDFPTFEALAEGPRDPGRG